MQRLGDPNPMDDVPDQDSAKIHAKRLKLYFAYPSNPGIFCFCPILYFLLSAQIVFSDMCLMNVPVVCQQHTGPAKTYTSQNEY